MHGVHFKDGECGITFCYALRWAPNVVQVHHLRNFCQACPHYSHLSGRGRGFLLLTYNGKELDDDSAYFFKTFRYPELAANAPSVRDYVMVQVRSVKEYELCFQSFTLRTLCHSGMTVRDLRIVLGTEARIPADALAFFSDGKELEDTDPLPDDERVLFTAQDYLAIRVLRDSTPDTVMFPVCGTVLDFISMEQNRFWVHVTRDFRRPSLEQVRAIELSINRVRLPPGRVLSAFVEPGSIIDITQGDPIPDRPPCACFRFRFESRRVHPFPVAPGCTLSFVRYAIAKSVDLPFEKVELFSDDGLRDPVDHRLLVGDFFSTGTKTIHVRVATIPLRICIRKGKEHHSFIPLCDRGFDLRLRLSELLKKDFHRIQLFFGGFIISDRVSLGRLGFTDGCLLNVRILEFPMVHLYFLDAQGRTLDYIFHDSPPITFGAVVRRLSKADPIGTGLCWEGRPLPRSTPLRDVKCDPAFPVSIRSRLPVMPLVFPQYPQWNRSLSVTVDTTIAEVIAHVLKLHTDIQEGALIVRVAKRKGKPTMKLIDLDRELETPITVDNIRFKRRPAPLSFILEDETFTVPVDTEDKSFAVARDAIAAHLEVPASAFTIMLDGEPLSDRADVLRSRTYQVSVAKCERRFTIELIPKHVEPIDWECKHVRQLIIDLGYTKRVSDLLSCLMWHEKIGPMDIVPGGIEPFPPDTLLVRLPEGQVIMIHYFPPVTPTSYVFTSVESPDHRLSVAVDDTMTVRTVKMNLAIECGRVDLLPGALRLQFGPLELRDATKIMDYGIPAVSLVTVTLGDTQTLRVMDADGDAADYSCSCVDTVGTLLEFLAAKRIPSDHLAVLCNGTERKLSQLLLDLPAPELRLVRRIAPLQVQVNGQMQTLNVTCDCSLAELAVLLARGLGVNVDRIGLKPPPDSDRLVFSVADVIECSVLEPRPAIQKSGGAETNSSQPRSVVDAATSSSPDVHSAGQSELRPGAENSDSADGDSHETKLTGEAAAPRKAQVGRQPVADAADPPKDGKKTSSHQTESRYAPDAERPKGGGPGPGHRPDAAVDAGGSRETEAIVDVLQSPGNEVYARRKSSSTNRASLPDPVPAGQKHRPSEAERAGTPKPSSAISSNLECARPSKSGSLISARPRHPGHEPARPPPRGSSPVRTRPPESESARPSAIPPAHISFVGALQPPGGDANLPTAQPIADAPPVRHSRPDSRVPRRWDGPRATWSLPSPPPPPSLPPLPPPVINEPEPPPASDGPPEPAQPKLSVTVRTNDGSITLDVPDDCTLGTFIDLFAA
jgi:hypothetical protein